MPNRLKNPIFGTRQTCIRIQQIKHQIYFFRHNSNQNSNNITNINLRK